MPQFKNIYTYENIQKSKLLVIPDALDKREGSVIWNAIAANSFEMALAFAQMSINQDNAFPDTATREYLIRHCAIRGIAPYPATRATIHGVFYANVVEQTPYNPKVGTRFTVQNTKMTYEVTKQLSDGNWELVCETYGTAGNISQGVLVPVDEVQALGGASIVEILIEGEDVEDTESLRARYMESLKAQPFAGNKAAYREMCRGISNVGACKVYRAYNGQAGHVGLCILDDDLGVPSAELISTVQETIDPNGDGEGMGLAPIDHIVHVFGATETTINVSVEVTPVNPSATWSDVATSVEEAVNEYMNDLRSKWDSNDTIVVRPIHIASKLLGVDTILDVKCLVNGDDENVQLSPTAVPKVGEISGTIVQSA